MTESQYIRSIHNLLPKEIYAWKTNVRFANGIPDAWYSGPKADLWVEWKYTQSLGQKHKPKLSALQSRWLNQRHDEGRNCWVIVGSPSGCALYTNKGWNSNQPDQILTKKGLVEALCTTLL